MGLLGIWGATMVWGVWAQIAARETAGAFRREFTKLLIASNTEEITGALAGRSVGERAEILSLLHEEDAEKAAKAMVLLAEEKQTEPTAALVTGWTPATVADGDLGPGNRLTQAAQRKKEPA